MKRTTWIAPLLLSLLLSTASGCGILIGNVKPVSEKSEGYRVMDLSQLEGWEKIEVAEEDASREREETEISDVAYQSTRTGSVISLNSGCRPTVQTSQLTLEEFTQQLLLGITQTDSRVQREIRIEGAPALQTTLTGRMGDEPVTLRTIVLRKDECVYDLMYVARPDSFPTDEALFSKFVQSLRLR